MDEPTLDIHRVAGYDPNAGLDKFFRFFSANNGIPGSVRVPAASSVGPPVQNRAMHPGLAAFSNRYKSRSIPQLFHSTQMLPYATENGLPPPIPSHIQGETILQYDVSSDGSLGRRDESCDCENVTLYPTR